MELRLAIANVISDKTSLDLDPTRNVLVTPGSDSGLLCAMMPFVSDGDEVMNRQIMDALYGGAVNVLGCINGLISGSRNRSKG